MSFSRPPSRIHPKVSTMPRQQSEAAHYLDIYKLTIEKKRLLQEMSSLDKKRDRIQERLETLEQQILCLEQKAQDLRETVTPSSNPSEPRSLIYPPLASADVQNSVDFRTVTLEY